MFRAFALLLAFFVGMLGVTAPGQPHDENNSIARATDPAECAINTAPRDTLEQGSGSRGVTERNAVGADEDLLVGTTEPFSGAAELESTSWTRGGPALRPRMARGAAVARGPPQQHA